MPPPPPLSLLVSCGVMRLVVLRFGLFCGVCVAALCCVVVRAFRLFGAAPRRVVVLVFRLVVVRCCVLCCVLWRCPSPCSGVLCCLVRGCAVWRCAVCGVWLCPPPPRRLLFPVLCGVVRFIVLCRGLWCGLFCLLRRAVLCWPACALLFGALVCCGVGFVPCWRALLFIVLFLLGSFGALCAGLLGAVLPRVAVRCVWCYAAPGWRSVVVLSGAVLCCVLLCCFGCPVLSCVFLCRVVFFGAVPCRSVVLRAIPVRVVLRHGVPCCLAGVCRVALLCAGICCIVPHGVVSCRGVPRCSLLCCSFRCGVSVAPCRVSCRGALWCSVLGRGAVLLWCATCGAG